MPTKIDPEKMPDGEYAIVEALGHRTLIGRVSEVERFGTKLLSIEPLHAQWMLGPVLLGGSSIYQFTPCPARVAWDRRTKHDYQLPASLSCLVPAAFPQSGPEPQFAPAFLGFDAGGEWADRVRGDDAREAGL